MNTSIVRIEDYHNENDEYVKSNFLISAKYRSSLFSNRIMAISLSRIGQAERSEDGYLTVRIKGREIKDILGNKGNDFFRQLSHVAATELTGHTIGWSNPETQEFSYISAVTKAEYINGELSVVFHKDLQKYLIGLKQSFTVLSLECMLKWKSTITFRLYELLRSKCYHRKNDISANPNLYRIEFDINELRLNIGITNADLASVKKVLNLSKGTPDWEKACAASPEKCYERWCDFRVILQKAIKEINEHPECKIKINGMDTKKSGRGGKVYGVIFYVEKLTDKKDKPVIIDVEEMDYDDLSDQIREIVGDVRTREAKAIGEAAKWDIDKIKRNYEYSKTKNVEELVGFMIKAVKEDWASSVNKSNKKSGRFRDFGERKYTHDDYENMLKDVGGV